MERAALRARLKAAGADLFFLWVINMAAGIAGMIAEAAPATMTKLAIATLIAYSMAEIAWSATPGKRLLKLRIMGRDGAPASRSRLLVRWLAKYPLMFSGPAAAVLLVTSGRMNDPSVLLPVMVLSGLVELLAAGSFLVALGAHRQTLYDLISRTAVYETSSPPVPSRS